MPTTKERIALIVAHQMGVPLDEVRDDTIFSEALDADSLDRIEIVMAIEDEFGIEVPDDDAVHNTVADWARYLEGRLMPEQKTALNPQAAWPFPTGTKP